MTRHQGIAASGGIAIGQSFLYQPDVPVSEMRNVESAEAELERLDEAIRSVSQRLEELEKHVGDNVDTEHAEIFDMQREFLDDPALIGEARRLVKESLVNAESAISRASDALIEEFETVEDEYFRQRADDIRDVSTRLVRALLGLPEASLAGVPPSSVVVARDLTPSDTATMKVENTLAVCTETGSATSHSAIISRSLGIPSVVGLGEVAVQESSTVIVDGDAGVVIVDPDPETLSEYRTRKKKWETRRREALARATEPVYTADGQHVEIVANVGSPAEARRAPEMGAEGIGLLRTEFLFLDRDALPDEDEQYRIYRQIFEPFQSGPIVVRTLDVGGDKELPSVKRLPEENPFLGRRGIRLSLSETHIFRTQIRALLRAASGFDVRIMFPMVATIGEFRLAKQEVQKAERDLAEAGTEHSKNYQLGIMIEVPSAAITAPLLAEEVDFFSIGTNDLTQYTLAMDRTNRLVSDQADPFDPAVLFLIERTVSAAHRAGKWAGMCGEMAGDPLALPFLLGVGLDELSMAGGRIPEAKEAIRTLNMKDLADVVCHSLSLSSAEAVRKYLEGFTRHNGTN